MVALKYCVIGTIYSFLLSFYLNFIFFTKKKMKSLKYLYPLAVHLPNIQPPFPVYVHAADDTETAQLCPVATKGLHKLCLVIFSLEDGD